MPIKNGKKMNKITPFGLVIYWQNKAKTMMEIKIEITKIIQMNNFFAIIKSINKNAAKYKPSETNTNASGKKKKEQHMLITIENSNPAIYGAKELTRVLISIPIFLASLSKTKCVKAH